MPILHVILTNDELKALARGLSLAVNPKRLEGEEQRVFYVLMTCLNEILEDVYDNDPNA